MEFLDNGGGKAKSLWILPRKKRPASSDNPEKAIISLKNDRETEYKVYIAVQNELVADTMIFVTVNCKLNPLWG